MINEVFLSRQSAVPLSEFYPIRAILSPQTPALMTLLDHRGLTAHSPNSPRPSISQSDRTRTAVQRQSASCEASGDIYIVWSGKSRGCRVILGTA